MLKVITGAAIAFYMSLLVNVSAKTFPCDVLFVEDSSAGSQKRMRVFAWSGAKTPGDRLETAKHLARWSIATTAYNFVDVFLMPSDWPRKRNKADATSAAVWLRYAPDPSKIPFMSTKWQGKRGIGKPKKGWGFLETEDIGSLVEDITAEKNRECGGGSIRKLLSGG